MVHSSTFQTPWYVPWSSSTKGYQYRIHPDGWSSPQALTKLNVWNRVGSNQKLLTSWIAEDYNLKPLGPECVAKRRFRIPTDCRAFRGSLQVGTSHLWWVNSHISRTWIVRPAMGMISLNHDSRVRSNSEVVIIYPDLWSQNHHRNTNCGLRSIRWAFQLDIVNEFFNQENQLQAGAPVSDSSLSWCVHSNFTMVYSRHMGMGQNPGTPGEHQNSW